MRAYLDAARYYASQAPHLFRVPDDPDLAGWLERDVLLKMSDDRFVRVAELDGEAVGFVVAQIQRPGVDAGCSMMREHSQIRLFIDGLIVRQDHWRRGIGTRLMHAAEAWGRDQGASVVLLDTYVDSDVSVPFYEQHLGYRRRSVRFRKPLT